ncbi:unnamed protein product [Meganyctiphanes norvegica]|uniref:Uncharacterized protein n=1 Tax=Meganyctiphanes norvegica TaxID=48144 RepID=A0AAV2RXE9_MEGNR
MMAVPKEPSGLQDAHKSRRSNKPQMERRRRERINQCLNELKNLVLTAQKKDPSRYNKLEKADILEMTVRHVQTMHRQKAHSPRQQDKYYAGYTRCAAEVTKFLESTSDISEDLRKRITSHLSPTSVTIQPKISPKPEQCKETNTVTTTFTINPPRINFSPISSSHTQLPLSSRVSHSGSPPTNATPPEAVGNPASPESAHGNSPHDLKSPRGSPGIKIYQDQSMVHNRPATSCLNVETPSRKPQPQLQDAPLDLAFKNNHKEPVLSNANKFSRRQNSLLKVASQTPKVVRYAPYIPQNIPQDNIHWRPW